MEATLKLNVDELNRLMKANHLTVTSLARMINVDRSTIYRWQNGDNSFYGKSVANLLKAFGLSENDFDKLFYIGN